MLKFKAHNMNLTAVALHPHNECLVSGHGDGTIYAWNQQKTLVREATKVGDIGSLVFSPDGAILACGIRYWLTRGRVELRETVNWSLLGVFECKQVNDLAWSPDGSLLAVASAELHIISGTTYTEINTLSGIEGRHHCVTFSKKGDLLIAAGDFYDPSIAVWNAKTLEPIPKTGNHETQADFGYLFTPFRFVYVSDDIILLLDQEGLFEYNVQKNSLKLLPDSYAMRGIAVSPEMKYFAYATPSDRDDFTVTLWIKEFSSRKTVHTVEGIIDSVQGLQFIGNDKILIGDGYGYVRIEEF